MAQWDAAKALPEPARSSFLRLKGIATDRMAASRHMASVMEDARSRRNSAQIASALYAKQMVNRSEAELVRLTAEADEAEADLRRIGADRDTRQNRSQNIGALVTRLEDFIGDLPRGLKVTAFDGRLPKIKPGTAADIVASTQREIERLKQRIADVSNAPFPVEEAIARVEATVDSLAEEGQPSIYGLMSGDGGVEWARDMSGTHVVAPVDTHALMAFLFRDQMIARLSKLCREAAQSDKREAIPSSARPRLIQALKVELLEQERIEAAALNELGEAGSDMYRPEMDPRACLGLASGLPAPRD